MRKTAKCPICERVIPTRGLVHGQSIRPSVAAIIKEHNPRWTTEHPICRSDLHRYRIKFLERQLATSKENDLELAWDSKETEEIASSVNEHFEHELTVGERVADKVASFGGSWYFIGTFAGAMGIWIVINSIAMLWHAFDPFPYILLNLMLSCLAAIQAPIIMMSQNRLEVKDRLRGEHDYAVDLKAELEIRQVMRKIDKLLRAQQVQSDMLAEIRSGKTDT